MNATLRARKVSHPDSFPQTPLEFEVEDLGRSVVPIQARGEATCDRANDLNEQLRSSLSPCHQFVILDLAGLSFLGPSALQALAEFGRG